VLTGPGRICSFLVCRILPASRAICLSWDATRAFNDA